MSGKTRIAAALLFAMLAGTLPARTARAGEPASADSAKLKAPEQAPKKEILPPILSDDEMKSVRALIRHEISRLRNLGEDAPIQIPKDLVSLRKKLFKKNSLEKKKEENDSLPLSAIENYLKESKTLPKKEQLSLEEWKELLAILRLNNRTLRDPNEKDSNAALIDLALTELKRIARDTKGAALNLPQSLAAKVKALDPTAFTTKDWVDLLGNVRAQAPKLRGKRFMPDLKVDIENDAKYNPIDPGPKAEFSKTDPEAWSDILNNKPLPVEPPIVVIQGVPEGGLLPNFPLLPPVLSGHGGGAIPPIGAGEPKYIAPNYFATPGFGFFDGGKPGLMIESSPPPQSRPLTQEDRAQLGKAGKWFSLTMHTQYEGDPQNQFSSCQITMVKREKSGGSCEYVGATARHCVTRQVSEQEDPNSKMTRMEIKPFGSISLARIELDPNGNDFALVYFHHGTECASKKEIPEVPLHEAPLKNNSTIVLDTERGVEVGKANFKVLGNSLVQLDVRDPINDGSGIWPGDSGGGVAVMGPDGPELVGVISSKPVDPALDGIGYFAGKSSIDWALKRLRPSQTVAHAPKTQTPHSEKTHGDLAFSNP